MTGSEETGIGSVCSAMVISVLYWLLVRFKADCNAGSIWAGNCAARVKRTAVGAKVILLIKNSPPFSGARICAGERSLALPVGQSERPFRAFKKICSFIFWRVGK